MVCTVRALSSSTLTPLAPAGAARRSPRRISLSTAFSLDPVPCREQLRPGLAIGQAPLRFSTMPRFAHLIFDLDGTLVDTKADLAAAINHVLASFALPQLSTAQVADYIGYGARVLVERALGPAHACLVSRGFALFMEYYGVHLLDHTRPY